VLAVGACRSDKSGAGGIGNIDEATLTYGYGPDPKGTVVYQPDVVIIGGGPKAIRSASANGLVWTIDGNAPGAKELTEGKVMFATSRAAGRVIKIDTVGPDLAVTLGPVSLTEVVKDADIKLSVNLAPESMVFQEIPDYPGVLTVPPPLSAMRPSGSIYSLASYDEPVIEERVGGDDKNFPPAAKTSSKLAIGDWEVEPYFSAQQKTSTSRKHKLGIKVQRKLVHGSGGGLKIGIDAHMIVQDFGVETSIPIYGGKVGPTSRLVLRGIEGIAINVLSGAEQGLSDNTRIRIEVPGEFADQIPPALTGGIPLVAHVKLKFIISTAFSAKNSTLVAGGKYALKGLIGYDGSKALIPTFDVVEPLVPSIKGASVGANGIVFAWETRVLVGLGVPLAMAGPYGKIVTSVGVSLGSGLGAPLARCRGATLKLDIGGGMGAQVSSVMSDFLKSILGKKAKFETEIAEMMNNVVNRTVVAPDVPMCRG
jgi:hypothetical protein